MGAGFYVYSVFLQVNVMACAYYYVIDLMEEELV